jgi:GNAT superfamily N-acetyltransferase
VLILRHMGLSDLPFAMRLVEIAGWNQIAADWGRLLRVAPQGCFLAEWDGQPAGTAVAMAYGTDCAWIGMVLVDPALRRRGIGMGLIGQCIGYLKSLGVRTIKLDATDEGRAVYLKQGFVDEYGTLRWAGQIRPSSVSDAECVIGPAEPSDRSEMAVMDLAAFGADRFALLAELMAEQGNLAMVARRGGELAGYGLARPGRLRGYIGPVVSERMDVAQRLVMELAVCLRQRDVYLDTTVLDPRWGDWLQPSGLKVHRRLTRMCLGTNDRPGDRRIWALSGFETG